MAQGLRDAATAFAKAVKHIFKDLSLQRMMAYQDDVVNYESTTLSSHLDMQHKIYDILEENQLVVNPVKTHLNYRTHKILGHVLNAEGRRADPGLAQVAREYIPALATVIAPIQKLAKKGVDINEEWNKNDECEQSFVNLKHILTTAPVLLIPDLPKPFTLHTDACRVGRGLGAVLRRKKNRNGILQPVAYWSRQLSLAERRYSTTELECTALHDAILHWRIYLSLGVPFDAVVDHYALVYMVTRVGGDVHHRLTRLCLELQGYTFRVTHRAGKEHLDADAVSRLLRHGEVAYVHTADNLRDDIGPLTNEDNEILSREFPDDKVWTANVIDTYRKERPCDN